MSFSRIEYTLIDGVHSLDHRDSCHPMRVYSMSEKDMSEYSVSYSTSHTKSENESMLYES